MATRWRVLNKRRRRRLQTKPEPQWWNCKHRWIEVYYGTLCGICDVFYAHGCAPWDDYEDYGEDEYPDDDYEGDGDCFHCGGDGYVDGYNDDPLFFAPGELERCSSCYGSGRAKDMTIW